MRGLREIVLVLALLAAGAAAMRAWLVAPDGLPAREAARLAASAPRSVAWTEPELDSTLASSADEGRAASAPDGALVVLARGGAGSGADLWVARRLPDGSLESPRVLHALSSEADELDPAFAGEWLWFASNREGSLGLDLWRARYDGGSFGLPERVEALASAADERSPAPAADEQRVLFASDRPAARAPRGFALHEAARGSDGTWSVRRVEELDGPGEEHDPALSADGELVVFAAPGPGGGLDLWRSVRRGARFLPPEHLRALASAADERAPAVEDGGLALRFARGAAPEAASGGSDPWRATSVELFAGPRARPWTSWMLALLLLLLGLAALLARRWRRLDLVWITLALSVLAHLLLALWLRRLVLEHEDAARRSAPEEVFAVRWLGGASASDPGSPERAAQDERALGLAPPERAPAQPAGRALAPAASEPLLASEEAASAPQPARPAAEAPAATPGSTLARERARLRDADALARRAEPALVPREPSAAAGAPARLPTAPPSAARAAPSLALEPLGAARAPDASAPLREPERGASSEPVAARLPASRASLPSSPSAPRDPPLADRAAPSAAGARASPAAASEPADLPALAAQLERAEPVALAPPRGAPSPAGAREPAEAPRALELARTDRSSALPDPPPWPREAGEGAGAPPQGAAGLAARTALADVPQPEGPGALRAASRREPEESREAAEPDARVARPRRGPLEDDARAPQRTLARLDAPAPRAPRPSASALEGEDARGGSSAPRSPLVPLGDGEMSPYALRRGARKVEALERFGGDERTEDAVTRGLAYLARIQRPLVLRASAAGAWGTEGGHWGELEHEDPKYGEVAVGKSALCLLAFLGAGHTPAAGEHAAVVRRTLAFLAAVQDAESGHFGRTSAYAHGIATLAFAECYSLTRDERLVEPLRRALAQLLEAQARSRDERLDGGWGYYGPEGPHHDPWPRVSVSAWQVLALVSARLGGFDVPEEALQRARAFLLRSEDPREGWLRYSHDPERLGSGWPTLPASTPAGLFALALLGEPLEAPRHARAIAFVLERAPGPWTRASDDDFVRRARGNPYFWYQGTLLALRLGGGAWTRWNEALKASLLPAQRADGSWPPIDVYARQYARDGALDASFSSALAVLSLEVYYRYDLPLLRSARARPADEAPPAPRVR